MLAAIEHQEPDRVPLYLHIFEAQNILPQELRWHSQFERVEKFLTHLGIDDVISVAAPRPLSDSVDPSKHPFYRLVTHTIGLARPRITLQHSGRRGRPLRVGISQQVDGTCVPDILKRDEGATYRQAIVPLSYEDKTREWCQILRLVYGFSLPAVAAYAAYYAATESYLKAKTYEFSNMWLDPRWYHQYLAECKMWRLRGDSLRTRTK